MNSSPLSSWETKIIWNINYDNYLIMAQELRKSISKTSKKILLVCSHPHCFTHGRGLRPQADQAPLIPFEENAVLPYPLYVINRGGGLTFHYPGQIILYPIIDLNYFHRSMTALMFILLESCKKAIVERFHTQDLHVKKEPFGLWLQDKKLASCGVGLDHFITEHGMALNYSFDEKMFNLLQLLAPCGLKGDLYTALEKHYALEQQTDFHLAVIQEFYACL
jgi:lipoate-protein ligase B